MNLRRKGERERKTKRNGEKIGGKYEWIVSSLFHNDHRILHLTTVQANLKCHHYGSNRLSIPSFSPNGKDAKDGNDNGESSGSKDVMELLPVACIPRMYSTYRLHIISSYRL